MTEKILKRMLQIVFQIVIIAAISFISSGRPDWWMAWAYLGIFALGECMRQQSTHFRLVPNVW